METAVPVFESDFCQWSGTTKAFTRLFTARNKVFPENFQVCQQDTVSSPLTNTSGWGRMYSTWENIDYLYSDFAIPVAEFDN